MVQLPDEHIELALGSEQILAQEPQLFTSVARLVSQPVALILSQSKLGAIQEILHVPFKHAGLPFVEGQ